MDIYYIDGKFVSEDEATLSVKDITVLRGFGVFDFLITYNKRPFRLEKHVERLENSARHIGLELNHSRKEICDIVMQTIEKKSASPGGEYPYRLHRRHQLRRRHPPGKRYSHGHGHAQA